MPQQHAVDHPDAPGLVLVAPPGVDEGAVIVVARVLVQQPKGGLVEPEGVLC